MLKETFDAVIMLTWSDWYTEMRSNRYHYASRFALQLPVIFVQPDLLTISFSFEATELPNVTVLHVYRRYGTTQSKIIAKALNSRHIIRPLVWIYNYFFDDFILKHHSPLRVYHATEDYFSPDFLDPSLVDHTSRLKKVLQHIDLLISISSGIHEDYVNKGGYTGALADITNGCDYHFWSEGMADLEPLISIREAKIALYQGGISHKIDFSLMQQLAKNLPDWEFRLCGRLFLSTPELHSEWQALLSLRNVKYLGCLGIGELKQQMYEASLGDLVYNSNVSAECNTGKFNGSASKEFQKANGLFEYLSCGLPVVSVPINSLEPYKHLFLIARTAEEFRNALIECQPTRQDPDIVAQRQAAARNQDYDIKFAEALRYIRECYENNKRSSPVKGKSGTNRLNILILYDNGSTHVNTIREHLESFGIHSRHHIMYANATSNARCTFDLSIFDAVVIHYSIRVSLTSHLSKSYADNIRSYAGLKILFIQDEYDTTSITRDWIHSLGIHIVYTCVPERYLNYVYPQQSFKYVEFIQNLTGFIPQRFESKVFTKPLKDRVYTLGYRGRMLPYWYGTLGYEKYIIGVRMREICKERHISTNIECDDSKRIYGEKWYEFIEDCRAVLGTESGSNVFDFEGKIRKAIEGELHANPKLTFEEVHRKYLKEPESQIQMNQISPKIFEAVALKTALVLFEGTYSGIIQSHLHYIPLKKDFSNVDEVLEKLDDLNYLEQLIQRAYTDIIESGRYGYKRFIDDFDSLISQKNPKGQGKRLIASISAWKTDDKDIINLVGSPIRFGPSIQLEQTDVLLSRDSRIKRAPSLMYDIYFMTSDLLPQKIKGILSLILEKKIFSRPTDLLYSFLRHHDLEREYQELRRGHHGLTRKFVATMGQFLKKLFIFLIRSKMKPGEN